MGSELIANGGPYNASLSEKEITVFDEEVVDGFFLFRITDAYGDGLCCEQGEGSFTIEYGSTVIESKFEVIRPGDKIEEEVYFGDESKCLPPGPTDAPTPPLPTSKPTDVPTSSPSLVPTTSPTDLPTQLPTSSPTATDKVLTEIMIQFDNFPEDITWKLFGDCNNVRELLGEDGPYDNPGDVDKLVTVFNEMLEEGLFLFNIFDSYGDGLCCEQGKGYFAIVYGSTIIYNEFRVTSGEQDANEERVEFGQETENCLAPTSEPTSNPTFSPTSDPTSNPTSSPTSSPTSDPTIARFNATLGVPLCAEEAVKCETLIGDLEWKNTANQYDDGEDV